MRLALFLFVDSSTAAIAPTSYRTKTVEPPRSGAAPLLLLHVTSCSALRGTRSKRTLASPREERADAAGQQDRRQLGRRDARLHLDLALVRDEDLVAVGVRSRR